MPIVPLNARPFQSTRPVWGATIQTDRRQQQREISIHAPRVGRDPDGRERDVWHSTDFNPRAPCGARRPCCTGCSHPPRISIHAPRVGRDDVTAGLKQAAATFQSTRPVWGATIPLRTLQGWISNFNPRAPCGARPPLTPQRGRRAPNFNPRAPCGARQLVIGISTAGDRISIHAPRVGRDPFSPGSPFGPCISIHAPRVGRDP